VSSSSQRSRQFAPQPAKRNTHDRPRKVYPEWQLWNDCLLKARPDFKATPNFAVSSFAMKGDEEKGDGS
jgi:hypothetical protein